jgi:Protein phosphatase 2C
LLHVQDELVRIECRTFWVQKQGNSKDEFEDAFAHDAADSSELNLFRCAVTDGATESSFAGIWANLLAKGYVEQISLDVLKAELKSVIDSKELSWFAEEKAKSGAFAALVGLEIRSNHEWKSEAVGDCCLFHLRSHAVIKTFPLHKPEDFDHRPYLISSNESSAIERGTEEHGEWHSGDVFLLASDGLARWMMLKLAEHAPIERMLLDLKNTDEFISLVQDERKQVDDTPPLLRNDDSTLMVIQVTG